MQTSYLLANFLASVPTIAVSLGFIPFIKNTHCKDANVKAALTFVLYQLILTMLLVSIYQMFFFEDPCTGIGCLGMTLGMGLLVFPMLLLVDAVIYFNFLRHVTDVNKAAKYAILITVILFFPFVLIVPHIL